VEWVGLDKSRPIAETFVDFNSDGVFNEYRLPKFYVYCTYNTIRIFDVHIYGEYRDSSK